MSRVRLEDITEAAKADDCKALEEILQKFPSQVDYIHGGVTALHQASFYGCTEAMKTLIRHGADLDISNLSNDSTPLHYAVEGNQPMAVQLLLRSRANVGEQNIDGLTPPQLAFRKKLKECLKQFNTFDPNIVFKVPTEEAKNSVINKAPSPTPQDESAAAIEVQENDHSKRVDDADRCIYCSERTAIITFRPCNHVYSCFECSPTQEVCRCGGPIEDRSVGDGDRVRCYIKDVQEFRRGYGECQRKLEELTKKLEKSEEKVTCRICETNPINCVMGCGHVFCIQCARKWKNRDNPDHYTPFRCSFCDKCSRYIKLHPRW